MFETDKRPVLVIVMLIPMLLGSVTSAVAQSSPSGPTTEDLVWRLQETERRLENTERRLRETETSLMQMGGQSVSRRREWSPTDAPIFETLDEEPMPLESESFVSPLCEDYCGPSVCEGLPSYCGQCKEGLSWNKAGGWRVVTFGKLEAETVFATDTTVSENYIVFAANRGLQKTERFDLTGQSSQIGLDIAGPNLGAFQVGGLILMDFHGNRPSRNEPGAYFISAYAEIYNDQWRFAFGQMGDTIAGWNAETVNWPGVGGLGFLGANQRGTLRLDRYLKPSDDIQWTLTGALTQPVVTDLAGLNDAIGQDNGLPNFEGQLLLGLGEEQAGERPFQVSLSGMYGEYFAAAFNLPAGFPPAASNTSKAYAISGAMQYSTDLGGFRGQLWNGRGLGTYMGGISQGINTETGETIRSTGGYGQAWLNLTDRVRVSAIAGIDDPLNRDLSIADNQRSQNRLIGGNIFVNISDSLRVGMDVWNVRTDYAQPSGNNEVMVIMTEASLSF